MKKILLLMVAVLCAAMSYAQTMVATLTHGDEIKMFYGNFAFQQAMSAADHGDVINLSAGAFQSADITKAVSIRGVGFMEEKPTYIINNFNIDIPADVTNRLVIEGVKISDEVKFGKVKNPLFMRDYIEEFHTTSGSIANNVMFVSCQVQNVHWYSGSEGRFQFINSYVSGVRNTSSERVTAGFVNCVVSNDYLYYLKVCDFVNCILTGNSNYGLDRSCSATNCVGLHSIVFRDVVAGSNNQTTSDEIFVDNNILNDLTEDAKAKYLGTDGTPVGMYGGIVPFSGTTSYPRITKMNVAYKTTADGKLSVDIEVSAGQ